MGACLPDEPRQPGFVRSLSFNFAITLGGTPGAIFKNCFIVVKTQRAA